MFSISANFKNAAIDYLYLLERNYAQKSSIELIGNRYQLTGIDRSILYRGVIKHELCNRRIEKSMFDLPRGSRLFLDGYNVIRTVGSYLLGKIVYISMDGFLRDASEMHRSTFPNKIQDKTINLLIRYLDNSKPEKIIIYLDQPVSKSGELAARLNRLFAEHALIGEAITCHSPDYKLTHVKQGIICTADSAVIDHSVTFVFDLAMDIIRSNYAPAFLDLRNILS